MMLFLLPIVDCSTAISQEEIVQKTDDICSIRIRFSVRQTSFIERIDDTDNALCNEIKLVPDFNSSPLGAENTVGVPAYTTVLNREIVANSLDNNIQVQRGQNTLFGNGGNDRFVLFGGSNSIKGGEGIDTVEIGVPKGEVGEVSKAGSTIYIKDRNNRKVIHKALEVEYVEFSDVIIDVETLSAMPIVTIPNNVIFMREGDGGSSLATFNLNLSSKATEDVVIEVAVDSDAEAGIDFIAPIKQLTIAAGNSSGSFEVEVLGDTEFEGHEEVALDLTVISGGMFTGGMKSSTVGVGIVDDDDRLITNEDSKTVITSVELLDYYVGQLYGDYLDTNFTIVGVKATNGKAILKANGDVEFTPAIDFIGIANIELTINDGTRNYTSEEEIFVIPVNDLLVANDDIINIDENKPLVISADELFKNDLNYDIERTLTISKVSNSTNGIVIVSKSGELKFIPNTDFNGTASFDYTVTDGIDVDTASVKVNVNPVRELPRLK